MHVPEPHCVDEFALTDEYAQHLRDVHSKLAAPEEFILEALKDVSVGGIVSKRRIIAGEANEVYDIRTSDERDLIVRISRDREKDFEQERWAIDQCRKRDVPVPTILAIKHFCEGTNPIDICIQDKLAGDLLSIAAASLPRDTVRDICVRIGELLTRVHGIRTKGHGYLNYQGEGQFRFTSDTLAREEERYLTLAKRTGFEETAMRAILTFLFELRGRTQSNRVQERCRVRFSVRE